MQNNGDLKYRLYPSPLFSKTAREWILSSALYDGIEDEDIRQIQTLLAERGANPNVLLPEYGITPFHMVVANDSTRFAVDATDICLQHGADPNIRSEDGLTPVHLAAMWGCSEVLHLLLASGGNPWLVDCFKKNAFDYAKSEGQEECYNILNMYCNSQPKPSSCSKSPYQLNLKRVILYKNDLQIVYEATPSSSQKNASTQTSPPIENSNPVKDLLNGSNEKKNTPPETHQNNRIYLFENIEKSKNTQRKYHEPRNIIENKVGDNNFKNPNHSAINSRLNEIIGKHRRNSTIFEYSPIKQDRESSSSGVTSWRDVSNNGEIRTSLVSELVEKLEETNILRQSLKSSEKTNDLFRNVTRRKKSFNLFEPAVSTLSSRSSQSYNSQQDSHPEPSRNKNDSYATPHVNCSPSIGFILDNLEETSSQIRGSSLFSDIASDVEAYTVPEQNFSDIVNIITEDENSSVEGNVTKYSLSDSACPYVICGSDNTKENDSNEYFQSCSERLPNMIDSPSISELQHEMCKSEFESLPSEENALKKDINLIIDSILNNIDVGKRIPVNHNIVSSTPERTSNASDQTNFLTTVDFNSDPEKQKWVEAIVSSSSSEDEQYVSISEEYEYTDLDEGVVLIEKRYLLNDANVASNGKTKGSSYVPNSTSETSEVSTISGSDGAYDTDELRRALHQHGFEPGPITGNTKRVYLRKLKRCRQKPIPPPQTGQPAYSSELLKTLDVSCEHLLYEWSHLEDSMSASFTCGKRAWREGQAKTSFTYLLLDPRLAHNLPAHASSIPHAQLWADFLRAIFYVGKGKRSRPYAHLYKAVEAWQRQESGKSNKIQRILDIWKSGQGVVCLHLFLNVIPVEAFTREAAMISALTLAQLTNEKTGEFYGSPASWNMRLKCRLGCVLLHRACKVFLAEGERQLRPADID